jgi:fatty acid amide hydrolase 2
MMDSRFEAALLDARYVDRVVQTSTKSEQQIAKETPFFGVPLSVKESIAVKGTLSVCYFTALYPEHDCHMIG